MYRKREVTDTCMKDKEAGLCALTEERIEAYLAEMTEQEKCKNTIFSYRCAMRNLLAFANGRMLTKTLLLEWKERLKDRYAGSTTNGMITAVNGYLKFEGHHTMRIKQLKVQKIIFTPQEKELKKEEYKRLVDTAEKTGKERLSLILQTICSTGIRISELKYITVRSLKERRAEIDCKGKRRVIFLPDKLIRILRLYVNKKKIFEGPVFVSRNGKALDRSNIWREMKKLCGQANVKESKVFPHNLRHLFARTYNEMEKDLSKLANLMGHSNIDTTRIYVRESSASYVRQLEMLDLIRTT